MPKPRVFSHEEMEQAVLLIKEYEHVFTGPDGSMGFTDMTQHGIDKGNNKPIKCQVLRKSPVDKENFALEVKKMLANGQIRPSKSPRKKDGSLCFCIDFRMLNKAMKKDAYPLPCIEEC